MNFQFVKGREKKKIILSRDINPKLDGAYEKTVTLKNLCIPDIRKKNLILSGRRIFNQQNSIHRRSEKNFSSNLSTFSGPLKDCTVRQSIAWIFKVGRATRTYWFFLDFYVSANKIVKARAFIVLAFLFFFLLLLPLSRTGRGQYNALL